MAAISKAIVLARGVGSRMREQGEATHLTPSQLAAADAGAKAMMPLGRDARGTQRPFLDYVLSGLADAGYTSVCLVVAPDHADIRRYYEVDAPPARIHVRFAEQALPRGTADAVSAAGDFIGPDPVLVINGDNYYPASALTALRVVGTPGTALFRAAALVSRGNIPAERVRAFAIGTVDQSGFLAHLIEKPTAQQLHDAGPAPLVSMNCWAMPPEIVEACRSIRPSARGELELTQAVIYAMSVLGIRFKVVVSDDGVLDLSRRDDVEVVAARLASIVPRP